MSTYFKAARKKMLPMALIAGICILFAFTALAVNIKLGNLPIWGYLMFGLFILVGLNEWRPLLLLKRDYRQMMKRYNLNSEMIAENLGAGKGYDGARLGNRYLFAYNSKECKLFLLEQLVWIYPHVTNVSQKALGMTVSNTAQLAVAVVDRERKSIIIPVKDTEEQGKLLTELYQRVPYAVHGYDAKVQQLTDRNFDRLVGFVEEQKKKRGM